MKHTPGPWKACLNYPGLIVEGHAIKQDDDVERPIAMLWVGGGTKGKPTQKANARLIAAAPELLEALKTISTYLDKTWGSKVTAEEDHVLTKIEQAITKAENK